MRAGAQCVLRAACRGLRHMACRGLMACCGLMACRGLRAEAHDVLRAWA